MLGLLPSGLVVEEPIRALLKFLGDVLRFFVTLEPCLVLLVEPPALAFQRLSCKVLLVCALAIVERVEKRILVYTAVQSVIVKYPKRLLRIMRWCVGVWILGPVVVWTLGIHWRGTTQSRSIEHILVKRLIGLGSLLGLFKRLQKISERRRQVVHRLFLVVFHFTSR